MKLYIIAAVLVLLSVSSCSAKPAKPCPNLVNCFVDPCRFSKCDAHPTAKCVANYCGGCNALWYLDGELADCSASVSERSVEIEDKKCQTVFCFVDPCGVSKCNKHPEAVCRANYCGGCHAWFYVAGKRVQCD